MARAMLGDAVAITGGQWAMLWSNQGDAGRCNGDAVAQVVRAMLGDAVAQVVWILSKLENKLQLRFSLVLYLQK